MIRLRETTHAGIEHHGSALTLAEELGMPSGILVHERCYAAFTRKRA